MDNVQPGEVAARARTWKRSSLAAEGVFNYWWEPALEDNYFADKEWI
ncbi:hypothetical protein [Marinococcus halophilus]|nr:hypothetical protein [Marinococcus halophilus]